VTEVSNLFANFKRSNASLHFKFVFILKLCHTYIIKNIKFKTTITFWRIILYIKLYIRGFFCLYCTWLVRNNIVLNSIVLYKYCTVHIVLNCLV
jgi:hypothetical protein